MSRMGKPKPTCFAIMPISNIESYDLGHFDRVYELLIQPAAKRAGFKAIRADKNETTNFIVTDIIEQILRADMVICDLSSNNPNVLYELGIRHTVQLPVTLIRDSRTRRVFDIQGIRDVKYNESLRGDEIKNAIGIIANVLKNTYANRGTEINSPIQLVEKDLVLKTMREDLTALKDSFASLSQLHIPIRTITIPDRNGIVIEEGSRIKHVRFGEGTVRSIDHEYVVIESNENHRYAFGINEPEIREAECIFDS